MRSSLFPGSTGGPPVGLGGSADLSKNVPASRLGDPRTQAASGLFVFHLLQRRAEIFHGVLAKLLFHRA